MTELVYTLVQAVHNYGALAVVASPAVALAFRGHGGALERRLAWTLLVAWGLQAATGAGFAAASYSLKGQLPEVTGVALYSLGVKLAATVAGCALAALLLWARRLSSPRSRTVAWAACLGLAVVALTAAAPLRWYL
ncbi:MAG TPA: hypothetical protein VIA62_14840 [Thermoanaerobaculia bacterium]|jgi:hypothetical protein|nr:hypothetical protein [Thermoanaerobaculia bacterium]